MKGLLKTIIDEKGIPSYPVSVADAIYVNAETTLTEKLKEIGTGLGMYVIDAERFGITTGFPVKPYAVADYEKANANILGINRAILWASEQGYTTIVMPKGEYSLCYPKQITLKSNMTFNLNGSVFKVMYDSENRSPYWNRNDADPAWKFDGISFMFRDARNSHLINGEIIGDMYERSFKDPNERWIEHTYGVSFGFSSSYCSVTHCKIHGFAGDNVNFTAGSTNRGGFNTGGILGDIDNFGVFVPGVVGTTKTIVTPMITIPDGGFELWGISGQGYSRTTQLKTKTIDVYYYTADDVFLGALRNQKVQTHISIPPRAKKYRMKFFDETDTNKNFDIFMDYGYHIHHNLVEYCELFNGHRGGITAGGSYNIIQYNMIRDNGKSSNTFLDGLPPFPDSTRYGINQEDSYGNNNIIQNNVISGGFHGILTGVYSTFIRENVFHNISGTAIVNYGCQYASITGNYIESGGIYLSGSSLKPSVVQIHDNFIRGRFDTSVPGYTVQAHHNHIVDAMVMAGDAYFEDNIVEALTMGMYVIGTNIKRNKFLSRIPGLELTVKGGYVLKENYFENFLVTVNDQALNALSTFEKCEFKDVTIRNHTATKQKAIFADCTFVDTIFTPTAINSPEKVMEYLIKNAKVKSTKVEAFIKPTVNVKNAVDFRVETSSFEISNDTFKGPFVHFYEVTGTNFVFVENSLEYLGATPLNMKYISKDTAIQSATIADTKLKNIVMETPTAKVATFNPETTYKITTNGLAVIDHNLNTLEPKVFATDKDGFIVLPEVRVVNANSLTVYDDKLLNITVRK